MKTTLGEMSKLSVEYRKNCHIGIRVGTAWQPTPKCIELMQDVGERIEGIELVIRPDIDDTQSTVVLIIENGCDHTRLYRRFAIHLERELRIADKSTLVSEGTASRSMRIKEAMAMPSDVSHFDGENSGNTETFVGRRA
jgi:hypothetical protein